ncbi:hypothetical protein CAPTEDRAFT_23500, partial [Capitella teleta]
SLAEALLTWYTLFSVTSNAMDGLLKILKNHGHDDLPATVRTLRKTPRSVPITKKSGMEYVYLGIQTQLKKILNGVTPPDRPMLLSFNVDGLPLFSSSNRCLWPVLCATPIQGALKVFPVALTYGRSKPLDLDFLTDTLSELASLVRDGFEISGRRIAIAIKCVVCDAPAKALVKSTKLCSGYWGCDKCTQKVAWLGRVVYPHLNSPLRTDESFRWQDQPEHHHGQSVFLDVDINMVTQFPIDYMHQVCLGVMRRLILLWIRGDRRVRISAAQTSAISDRLVSLVSSIPSIFARKPRPLSDVDRWKATEFRQFLLYTGPVVLRGILRDDLFQHFLSFSVAISILVNPNSVEQFDYAKGLLKYFVSRGKDLYGGEFCVYNVHSMLHITDEAQKYGSLDECSAFPFENFLFQLKKLVRSGRNPMAQIVNRL